MNRDCQMCWSATSRPVASGSRRTTTRPSVAIGSPQPVTAVVVMPGHTRWPGLLEGLTAAMGSERAGKLRVVALRAAPLRQSLGRHDADWAKEPAVIITPNKRARFYLPAPSDPDPAEAAHQRRQSRRVLIGAVAVAVVATGCAAVWAAPWQGGGHLESRSFSIERAIATPIAQPAPTTPLARPTVPVPLPTFDTAEALAPVVEYEAPIPPPTTNPPSPPASPSAAPRPNQPASVDVPAVIPNPIPGLPPIVLP